MPRPTGSKDPKTRFIEAGRLGGLQRGKNLTKKQIADIGSHGGNVRWHGLSADERKKEWRKGRAKYENGTNSNAMSAGV